MTNNQLSEFYDFLTVFSEISRYPINENIENWILQNLPKSLPFFTHLVIDAKFDSISRITINKNILNRNKRIYDIKFLKYPPPEFVKKYGRCNMKNESVLYASPLFTTAMNEMRPKTGDLITKTTWKLKNNHSLKLCPIFHVQPTNGTFNPRTFDLKQSYDKLLKENYENENDRKAVNALSEFLAYNYSKYVDPNKNNEYIFSAYFSHKILYEFEKGTIEGIYYPSVKENLSFENLAIKPDVFEKHYVLEKVEESVVVSDLTFSKGYMMKGISDCKDFNFETDEILWDENKFYQSQEDINELIKLFNIEFKR